MFANELLVRDLTEVKGAVVLLVVVVAPVKAPKKSSPVEATAKVGLAGAITVGVAKKSVAEGVEKNPLSMEGDWGAEGVLKKDGEGEGDAAGAGECAARNGEEAAEGALEGEEVAPPSNKPNAKADLVEDAGANEADPEGVVEEEEEEEESEA